MDVVQQFAKFPLTNKRFLLLNFSGKKNHKSKILKILRQSDDNCRCYPGSIFMTYGQTDGLLKNIFTFRYLVAFGIMKFLLWIYAWEVIYMYYSPLCWLQKQEYINLFKLHYKIEKLLPLQLWGGFEPPTLIYQCFTLNYQSFLQVIAEFYCI